MEISWRVLCFCIGLGIIELCNGLPMELLSTNEGPNAQLIGVLVAVMVSVCVVLAFVGCACCQRRRGFKEFRDSPVTASVVNDSTLTGDDPGHVNPIAASSEFTIFTPLSPPHHNNNVFRTHHQPVISYIQNENVSETQNKLNNTQIDGLDVSSWFDGSQSDFPRTKLKYIRELGSGWFGRVVEGEAQGINNNQEDGWAPVAVRILESSASAHEQALFLHEAAIYRLVQPHQHVLKLWGRSLEATPLLLIQEFCPRGDLKKFLLENQSCSTSPVMLGLPLQFCCQLASALHYLHDNNIPHLDIAARMCQITSDMNLKLGDYGLAVSRYPRDYYQGTPAIPVRWCSPESLNFTNTTLQPKQVTCAGNIWSLGVTMWEICEWGAQPYDWLTDDEVISQVMGVPHVRLPQPALTVYYIHSLYRLMQLCWQSTESRPLMPQIYAMLVHLMQTYHQDNSSKSPSKVPEFSVEGFDSRWDTFKPNTIVKTDNHISSDLELTVPADKTTDLTSLSSTSEVYINPSVRKSDSLNNLHGSFENLADDADAETPVQNMDSWLQNVASHTGDMQYVRGLSQAIQALDSALASEQTSSSGSSYQPSPAPEQWDPRTPPTKFQQQKIEFKLGLSPKSSANDSSNLMDSIFLARRSESSSETEDETWRKRIEIGAYSEKVRQKSKSVADLMVLTHIDCSDTDSETPQQSLEYKVNKNVRCVMKNSLENSSFTFGSEGNLLAVQDTFQEELRKLQEERRDSLLFVPARHGSDGDISDSVLADVHQCISRNDCDSHPADNTIDLSDIMLHRSFELSDMVYSTPEKKYSQSQSQLPDQQNSSPPNVVRYSASDQVVSSGTSSGCATDQKCTEPTFTISGNISSESVIDQNLLNIFEKKSTSIESQEVFDVPEKNTSETLNVSKLTDTESKINLPERLFSQTEVSRMPSENFDEKLIDSENVSDKNSGSTTYIYATSPDSTYSILNVNLSENICHSTNASVTSDNSKIYEKLAGTENKVSENLITDPVSFLSCSSDKTPFVSDVGKQTEENTPSEMKSDQKVLLASDTAIFSESPQTETDRMPVEIIDLNLSTSSAKIRDNRIDIFEGVSDDSIIPDQSLSSSSFEDLDHKSESPNRNDAESIMKPVTVDLVESIIGNVRASQPSSMSAKTTDFLRNEQEFASSHIDIEIFDSNINKKETEYLKFAENSGASVSKNETKFDISLSESNGEQIIAMDIIPENSLTKEETRIEENKETVLLRAEKDHKLEDNMFALNDTPVNQESKIHPLPEEKINTEILLTTTEKVELDTKEDCKLEDIKVSSDDTKLSQESIFFSCSISESPEKKVKEEYISSLNKHDTQVLPSKLQGDVIEHTLAPIRFNSAEEISSTFIENIPQESSSSNVMEDSVDCIPEESIATPKTFDLGAQVEEFLKMEQLLQPHRHFEISKSYNSESSGEDTNTPNNLAEEMSVKEQESIRKPNLVEISKPVDSELSQRETEIVESSSNTDHEELITNINASSYVNVQNIKMKSEESPINKTIEESSNVEVIIHHSNEPRTQLVDLLSIEPSADSVQDNSNLSISNEPSSYLLQDQNLLENAPEIKIKLVESSVESDSSVHLASVLENISEAVEKQLGRSALKHENLDSETVELTPNVSLGREKTMEMEIKFDLPTQIHPELYDIRNESATEKVQIVPQEISNQIEECQDAKATNIDTETIEKTTQPITEICHKTLISEFLRNEQEHMSSQIEAPSCVKTITPEILPYSTENAEIKNTSLAEIPDGDFCKLPEQPIVKSDVGESSSIIIPVIIASDAESQDINQTSTGIVTKEDFDASSQSPVFSAISEIQDNISESILPIDIESNSELNTDVNIVTSDPKESVLVTYRPFEKESRKDHQNLSVLTTEVQSATPQRNKPVLRRIPTIIIEDVDNDIDDQAMENESFISFLNDKQAESTLDSEKEEIDHSVCEQKTDAQFEQNNDNTNLIQSFLTNEIAASSVPANTNTLRDKVIEEFINEDENLKLQSVINADVKLIELLNEEMNAHDLETATNNEYVSSTISKGAPMDESCVVQKLENIENKSKHIHEDCKSEALTLETQGGEYKMKENLLNILEDEEKCVIIEDNANESPTEGIKASDISLCREKINDKKNQIEEVPQMIDEICEISDKASCDNKIVGDPNRIEETGKPSMLSVNISDSVQETTTQVKNVESKLECSEVKTETTIEPNLPIYVDESRLLDLKSDEEDRYSESDILSALENADEIYFKEIDKPVSDNQGLNEIDSNNKQAQLDEEMKTHFSLIQNFINNERTFASKDADLLPSILGTGTEIVKDESASNKDDEKSTIAQISTANLLDLDTLNDSPNVHQINQVYNVFSVTVDHRPPIECFTSPVKNLYSKVYDQQELITDINDLLLENDKMFIERNSPEKNISGLSSVCTSRLPNEQLLNVLNNPPLLNGFENHISDKFIVEGKHIDTILEDSITHKIKSGGNSTKFHEEFKVSENLQNTRTVNEEEMKVDDVSRCEAIAKEQVTDLDDSEDSLTENGNVLIPDSTNNALFTSTPFMKKFMPKNTDIDDTKGSIFSFVSEGDEQNSDFQTTVILGPCEDYTLGLYSGLKTTFEKYSNDDRPEEELLQFSSNFMPFDEDFNKTTLKINDVNDKYYENNRPFDMNQSVDYSLETWDRFLGKSLLDQQNNTVFNNFSPKHETTDVFGVKENKQFEVKCENPNQTFNAASRIDDQDVTTTEKNNATFTTDGDKPKQLDSTYNCNDVSPLNEFKAENGTFVLDKTYEKDALKENSPDKVVSSSWEPGEGWFLHPQVPPEDLTGQIDISTSDNVDNSYVGFTLDEECVNALRNELAAKLPHAQGMTHEEQQEQDDWDSEERSEIIVKYNVYATPLSPIPEESYCDDTYGDQMQNRDGSDSDSDWSEPCMGRTSQLEDILVIDTETHTALILESPSMREPQHRHTPSQDSCCSNDTLFNLEDLNYGPIDADHSPLHHGLTAQSSEQDDLVLQVEVTDNETLKLSLSKEDEEDVNLHSRKEYLQDEQADITISSNSVEDMNITYTKPDINIDVADAKSLEEENQHTEREDLTSEKDEPVSSVLASETTEEKTSEDKPIESKGSHKLELKLEPGTFGVAPLPSPEDIPWRQLPASLLTYNEVVQNDKYDIQQESDNAQGEELDTVNDDESTEMMNIVQDTNLAHDNNKLEEDLSDSVREGTLDTDLYSNLTDIRFSGPCDTQLMSTSFSESADYAEEKDWDSGSDTRSSSSGEFIWKEGEHEESLRALHAASHDVGVTEDLNPMDVIEEENSDSSNDDSDDDDDDGDDDIEETEFVPSAWDAQATPTKSALRSPEKSNKRKNQQKGVWFKKQKYHCVYEYPREPESPVAPSTDLWRPLSDFSNFTDWELDPESCVPPFEEQATTDCCDGGGYDTVLDKYISRTNYPLASGSARHRDLYQLNPFPDFTTGITSTDEDFFISSSARPFQTLGQGSQFFPGQDTKAKGLWQEYQSSSSQSSKDYSDNITPDSGVEDVTPASISDITLTQQLVQLSPPKTKVQTLKHLATIAANKTAPNDTKVQDSLGGLRHTRNRLKLDLPPSPNSFTSTRTFTIDVTNDPVVNREVPAFTTFGKSRFSVQHVQTPTEDVEATAMGTQTKSKNVSFEALPYKPMHVTTNNSVYILNNADRSDKHKPVEMVQGEASLLDSADEDSGIESSANATLERHQQQVLH